MLSACMLLLSAAAAAAVTLTAAAAAAVTLTLIRSCWFSCRSRSFSAASADCLESLLAPLLRAFAELSSCAHFPVELAPRLLPVGFVAGLSRESSRDRISRCCCCSVAFHMPAVGGRPSAVRIPALPLVPGRLELVEPLSPAVEGCCRIGISYMEPSRPWPCPCTPPSGGIAPLRSCGESEEARAPEGGVVRRRWDGRTYARESVYCRTDLATIGRSHRRLLKRRVW